MLLIPVADVGIEVGIGKYRGRGEDHDELPQRVESVIVRIVVEHIVSRRRQDLAKPRYGNAVFRFAGRKRLAVRRIRRARGERRKTLRGIAYGRRQLLAVAVRETFRGPHAFAEIAIGRSNLVGNLVRGDESAFAHFVDWESAGLDDLGRRCSGGHGRQTLWLMDGNRRTAWPKCIHLPATESTNHDHGRRGDPSAYEDHHSIGCLHTIPRDRLEMRIAVSRWKRRPHSFACPRGYYEDWANDARSNSNLHPTRLASSLRRSRVVIHWTAAPRPRKKIRDTATRPQSGH